MIEFDHLPGAEFSGDDAVAEFLEEAGNYERIVAEFARTGDVATFTAALIDHDGSDSAVAWHLANRGLRQERTYAALSASDVDRIEAMGRAFGFDDGGDTVH